MGSGESDVTRYLRAGRSLDFFRRCDVSGCLWQVHLPEMRCEDHGGEHVPQYATGSEGDILGARHVVITQDFDG